MSAALQVVGAAGQSAAPEFDPQAHAERAVDDIMDALTTLETSPRALGKREIDDLEIAHARLSRYLGKGGRS